MPTIKATPTTGNASARVTPPTFTHTGRIVRERTSPTPGNIASVLRAILSEVTPVQRPYSGDSYLPDHLVQLARTAIDARDKPRTEPLESIERQQAIENALSAALWHVRHNDSVESLQCATGRAIRAVAMLKQSCAEGRAD